MEEHPNVTLYREIHEKIMQGDMERMFDALADDIVWHQIGGPTIHGKAAVVEEMSGLEGAEFDLAVHDILGNDEHVVGLVEATVSLGDESLRYRTVEIAHIKDGKVTERWAFSDDTQRIIDFFGGMGSD